LEKAGELWRSLKRSVLLDEWKVFLCNEDNLFDASSVEILLGNNQQKYWGQFFEHYQIHYFDSLDASLVVDNRQAPAQRKMELPNTSAKLYRMLLLHP